MINKIKVYIKRKILSLETILSAPPPHTHTHTHIHTPAYWSMYTDYIKLNLHNLKRAANRT